MKNIILGILLLSIKCYSQRADGSFTGFKKTDDTIKYVLRHIDSSIVINYYKTNKIKRIQKTQNSIKHGIYFSFYRNGSVKKSGNYSNGKKDGKFDYYSANGSWLYTVIYEKGKKIRKYAYPW